MQLDLSDPVLAEKLNRSIHTLAGRLNRPVKLMEVCGTHTVSLRQHGIHSLLPHNITLVSGPGCPVCVTPSGYIDNAFELIEKHDCIVASFGDMLKVPGGDGRALSSIMGSNAVKMIYSPMDLAGVCEKASQPVVFLGIGFETTIPTVLAGLKRAVQSGTDNLFLYTAFKTVPPALDFLLAQSEIGVDGFILPGHVSVIIGSNAYALLRKENGIPGAITGFEPIDMLVGIRSLLTMLLSGERDVQNEYPRAVKDGGNSRALSLMNKMLRPYDAEWRGIGKISHSGLKLREAFTRHDAAVVFELPQESDHHAPGCLCAKVIQGLARPPECGFFGARCTPEDPVGPCMVSSEGTCAAYLRYGG